MRTLVSVNHWIRRGWLGVLLVGVMGAGALGQSVQLKGTPKVQASLLADHAAIAPGQTVELAVALKIESGWHIYWANSGEGGLPTKVSWTLPEGFEVGPTRFPAPQRYVDQLGSHTFILEGEPWLLASLKAPGTLPAGEKVEISAEVRWLACKEACIPGSQMLTLTLPVVAGAGQAKLAHADDFDYARKQLPQPMGEAAYLKGLSAVAGVDRVVPGSAFEVAVIFEVADGHHLNAHNPLAEGFIPTDLFDRSREGVTVGKPAFPAGKVEETPLGKMAFYTGRTVIRIPVEADAELAGTEVTLSGVLTYQACDDKTKQCFAPVSADWAVTLPIASAGQKATATHAEIFEAGGSAPERGSAGFSLDSDIQASRQEEHHSLIVWLFFAFLAGLILNVTPCVLPVISIKVLSFVQQASESPARVLKLGLAFSLGMLIVFNVLAALATGAGLVWGQHFQSPVFTIAMASIVFAFGLSLFGVYTLSVPTTVGNLAGRTEGEGYGASIAKGMLATVMGTPCVGPFLGPVLVWATAQPAVTVFLVFNVIGIGMAFPYVALTANPKWLRFVPKPGPWLTTFKQGMAFLLMATVVYLLYIIEGQLGGKAIVATSAFLVMLGLACWVVGTWMTITASRRRWWTAAITSLLIILAGGWLAFGDGLPEPNGRGSIAQEKTVLPWEDFSMERLTELTAGGRTVLLDITANWCPNCKWNTAFVFETPELAAAVQKYDAVPMLADWTARGPEIERLINKLAPGGSIPICAIFPASRPNEPIVMLGILTKQQVIDALAEASK